MSPLVQDIAGITVVGFATCVNDPIPNRCSALVCWMACCFPLRRMDQGLLLRRAAVSPCVGLVADAVRGAFGLLHSGLLNEDLRLAAKVACLRR
jgi:hypothetical protein